MERQSQGWVDEKWDDGGLSALPRDEREMVARVAWVRSLRVAPAAGWDANAFARAIGVPEDRVLIGLQESALYKELYAADLAAQGISPEAATPTIEAAALEAAKTFDPSYEIPIQAFIGKRIWQALVSPTPRHLPPDPMDDLALEALNEGSKATRILYFLLRKQLKAKREWWVRGWTRRELVAELLLCLFEILNSFRAKRNAGIEVDPREILQGFWTRCRQRLSALIKAAQREADAVVAWREFRDPRDRYGAEPVEGDPLEAGETDVDKVKRAIAETRRRATSLQARVLVGLEAILADRNEVASVFGLPVRARRVTGRPRHIKLYVEGATNKAISKALRGLRILLAEELRREGLHHLVPRGWRPSQVR